MAIPSGAAWALVQKAKASVVNIYHRVLMLMMCKAENLALTVSHPLSAKKPNGDMDFQ